MKVLILGASGFVGDVLYHKLKSNDTYEVVGTYKTNKNDEYVYLDVTDKKSIESFFNNNNFDAIIWAIMDFNNENVIEDIGLQNLLMHKEKFNRFFYISTNVFNGGKGNYKETDKSDYVCKGHPADQYILAKIRGEKIAGTFNNHMIIRPGVIYGQKRNGDWDNRISRMINFVENHKNIEVSKNRLATWIDVDCLTDYIIRLLSIDLCGIIHIGSDICESGYSINIKVAIRLGLDLEFIIPIEDEKIDNTFNIDLFKNFLETCKKNII